MAKLKNTVYTLVEHSGLPNAVEVCSVTTEAKLQKVKDAGGVVFNDWKQADDAEYEANYHPSVGGINPYCFKMGAFAKTKHDGRKVFVPITRAV